MPQLVIETNLPRSKIPADFAGKAVPLLAEIVNRTKEMSVVVVHPDVMMNFGGSDAPTALARVLVVERLGSEENKKYSKALFDLIEKELGVPQDRMFIEFEEKLARDVGYRGTTLEGAPEDTMPALIIETNLPHDKIPADFVSKAAPLLAETVDRDKELILVAVHPDVKMSFGGTDGPTALARVVVIDRLGSEENKKYSKILFDFIEKELGVPQDRMFIEFEEKLARDVGYRGTTLEGMF